MNTGPRSPRVLPGSRAEDARLQLEGRVEAVEAARARYRELSALVGGLSWKRRLRERPEALQAVLRQEPALEEVLRDIQRKAQAEQWPPAFPVLATVRALHRQRARLMARVLRRLGRTRTQVPGLQEALGRLDTLAQTGPFRLAPGEVGLCAGRSVVTIVPFQLKLGLVLCGFVGTALLGGGELLLLGALAASVLATRLWRVRYWLTSERLVWQPPRGERRQIPLGAIPRDGLSLPLQGGVRVAGAGETLTLYLDTGIPSPERLSFLRRERMQSEFLSMLELRRRAPLLGGAAPVPLAHVLCAPARLHRSDIQTGIGVLRPGYIAFFPADRSLEVLRAVTHEAVITLGDGSELDMTSLLEQLCYLPTEAAFDAYITRAVSRAGGGSWSRKNLARQNAQHPVNEGLRFYVFDPPHPAAMLTFQVDPSQEAAAEHILVLQTQP